MKRIIIGLIIITLFMAVGCTREGTNSTDKDKASEETEAPDTKTQDEEATDKEAETGLDGQQLVETRCTRCHSRERIDKANKSSQEWESTVNRMVDKGAQLSEEEQKAVIDYLSDL